MIHLIKLAVGIRDVKHLADVQKARAKARGEAKLVRVHTRHKPVRPEAEDGSLYWVIQGVIRVRQKVRGFETALDAEGKPYCLIVLDRDLVPILPTPRRPFQGWRYLAADAAPADISVGADGELPPEAMLEELRELGLL